MIATADSNVRRAIWTKIRTVTRDVIKLGPVFPNSVSRRWPAIILAVNRTAKVPGRIILLIVSIHTIKGINTLGVPWGTKWVNIWFVWLIHPYNINDIHNGRANLRVIIKCLVLVKIYGKRPIKLLKRIIENNEINRREFPVEFFSINNLNSLWRLNKILNHNKE